MNIAIIGCGVYSMAIAKRLSEVHSNTIKVWTEDSKKVKEYEKSHKVPSIFKEEVFNDNIKLYDKYYDVLKDAEMVFIITASKFINKVLVDMKDYFKPNMKIIIGSKGFDIENNTFFSKSINFISSFYRYTFKAY